MASKKKGSKSAQVGDLTAAHLAKMSRQIAKIAEGQDELVDVVKAFKLDVQVNFRELQEKLVSAIATAVADSVTHVMSADRARMDALEAALAAQAVRLAELEKKAS